MKKIKIKNCLFVLVLAFTMAMVGMLPTIISGHGLFNLGGDYIEQMVPFNTYGVEKVKNGSFGWDWFSGVGTDFIGSYSFYFLGSPFFWIMSLFPVSIIRYIMPVFLAFKVGVAASAAYAYFTRFIKNESFTVLGALLYAFSGYQFFNYIYFFFADATALFPLLMLSFDMLVEDDKKGFFAFMTAMTALTNYFFFFGEVLFVIIYFIIKCVSKDIKFSWKKFLNIAFEAVIGVCISAVLLIPTVLYLSSNSRVSGLICGVDAISYSDNTIIPKIFQTLFIGPDCPSRPQLFKSESNGVNWASVAISIPIFSMIGVSVYIKNNKKSFVSRLILISLIFALIPVLNSAFTMFNELYYARWFYMPILFICLATVKILDDNADLTFGLKFQGVGLVLLLLMSFLPDNITVETTNFDVETKTELFGMIKDGSQFVQNMLFSALFLVLLYAYNKKRSEVKNISRKLVLFSALFITVYESIYITYVNSKLTLFDDTYFSYVEEDYKNELDLDEEDMFFRIDNHKAGYTINNSVYLKLSSASSFHSIAASSLNDFYEEVKNEPRKGVESYNETDYSVYALLSVKYILNHSTNDDLNVECTPMKDIYGFSLYDKQGCYYIYKNENYVPIGNMYSYCISKSRLEKFLNIKFKNEDASQNEQKVLEDEKYHYKQLIMLRALVLDDADAEKMQSVLPQIPDEMLEDLDEETYRSDCSKLSEKTCSEFSYDENGYEAHIDADRDGIVYFSVPYSEGFKAKVNGKDVEISVVHYGMTGIPVTKGENDIKVSYETPGLNTGIKITFAGIAVFIIYSVFSLITSGKKKPEKTAATVENTAVAE